MAVDILIIVDCNQTPINNTLPSDSVQMFASDPSIVRNHSQGSTELWVQVPRESYLRWRAVPRQLTDEQDHKFQVVITQVTLWGPNGDYQLDAPTYLPKNGWAAFRGTSGSDCIVYGSSSQNFTFPGNSDVSNPANLTTGQINDPYVQATCDGLMPSPANFVAYSFTCTVFKDGNFYATVSWDQYVTIYP
jgi:hypothetical protein